MINNEMLYQLSQLRNAPILKKNRDKKTLKKLKKLLTKDNIFDNIFPVASEKKRTLKNKKIN